MIPRNSFLCAAFMAVVCATMQSQTFTCSKSAGRSATSLSGRTLFTASNGGFDLGTIPTITKGACTAEGTFFLSVPVSEGNYLVRLELGSDTPSETTVRAEARRLMLRAVRVPAGSVRTESFVVNVRRPAINGSQEVVKRKPREMNSLNWDSKLTLEFAGHPAVRTISISPAPESTTTVYLAGDSTVVDQDNEPWAAWGQMLPSFFKQNVSIANDAESGETILSFEKERRFEKIFASIKRGDYLFLQFGHNDQKPGNGNVPIDVYKDELLKYIHEARAKGATPVLVTSMNRRTFDADGHVTDTLAPYPQAVREIAGQEHVALVDLNAMSKVLYESVGEKNSKSLFVYAPAGTYPGQNQALHDDTHFNSYGAYELARCVVSAIRRDGLPLANALRDQSETFDPAKPDASEGVMLPVTPYYDLEKPYER